MNKVLILSLTRMGDLLQATPLMAGLKKKHPHIKLDVLISSDFASIADSIPLIDETKVFNLRQFTPAEYKKELSLVTIYHYLEKTIKDIKKSQYDTVINLSHSKLSAILTTLIDVKDIRGITSNEVGNRMVKHPWLRYFANIIFNRDINNFNIVDIYLKSGDVEPAEERLIFDVDEESLRYSKDFLSENDVKENDFLIGFQPGSSLKGRRWSTKSFAELGNLINKELKGKVIIFGVGSEAELGEEIGEMMECKPINAMGKTSVQQLAALVKRCGILITNDTGTMHIATAIGTKVVGLFFAHAYPIETGPYSKDNIVFQANISCSPCSYGVNCNNVVCVEYVTVDHIFQVLKLIKEGKTNEISFSNDNGMEKIKIFRSDFDENQMLEFLPLIKRSLTVNDFVRFLYRIMWVDFFDSKKKEGTDILNDKANIQCLIDKLETYYDIKEFSKIYPYLKSALNEFNKLWEISKQASRFTEKLIQASSSKPPEINKIKSMGEKISDFDEKINVMGHTIPNVKPIIDVFKLAKENLIGDDVIHLAKETLNIYKDMNQQAGNIYQLGCQISEEAKFTFDSP